MWSRSCSIRRGFLQGRYTYRGGVARGISLFSASGDLDTRAILGTKFRRFEKYRVVQATALTGLGLLLPTFNSPHWTLMFLAPNGSGVDEDAFLPRLLAILGPVLDNPKYQPSTTRRER